jgi:hypothetical protein
MKGEGHLEDPGIDGRKILDWILGRLETCELNSSESGQGPVTCSCEDGNEPLEFIKGRGI